MTGIYKAKERKIPSRIYDLLHSYYLLGQPQTESEFEEIRDFFRQKDGADVRRYLYYNQQKKER